MAREFLDVKVGHWVMFLAITVLLVLGGSAGLAAVSAPAAADFDGDVTASQFFTDATTEDHESEANVTTVTNTDDTASFNGDYNFTGIGSERVAYYKADVSGLGQDLKLNLQESGNTIADDVQLVDHSFVDSDSEGFSATVPSDATDGEYTHTVVGDTENRELHFKDTWRQKSDSTVNGPTTEDLADLTITLGQGDSDNDEITLTYQGAQDN